MTTERRDEKITIRLPASLLAAIEREAERGRRTPSDLIVNILSDAFGERPAESAFVIPGALLRQDLAQAVLDGGISDAARTRARRAVADEIVTRGKTKRGK